MRNFRNQIIQVNTSDIGGGAEKVVMDLHRFYVNMGLSAILLVGKKKSDLHSVLEFPKKRSDLYWENIDQNIKSKRFRGADRLLRMIAFLKDPMFSYANNYGYEYYHYPGSKKLINAIKEEDSIIHYHNLHRNYFDLRCLPKVSQTNPVVITLHDEYLYTGHCAATFGCDRWQIGCGQCPHLDVYPEVKKDNTRINWRRKKAIFAKSQLTLVTPSVWLAQKVKNSYLSQLPVRVIPNGIDLEIFKPADIYEARENLGLPKDAFIILFVAKPGRGSHFKDFDMLDRAIIRLSKEQLTNSLVFLALGGQSVSTRVMNGNLLIEKPFVNDPKLVAKYYQASNLYIHPSKADNFPLVTLEAMACGKPVVSTSVGGIPEQIREGVNGFTVSPGDDQELANQIRQLIKSPQLVKQMGESAIKIAREEFSLSQMAESYLRLYEDLMERQLG